VEIKKLKDEIKEKNEQIALLEKQIADSINASHNKMDQLELSQVSLAFLLVALAAFLFLRSQNLCCLLFYSAVCFCIDGAIE
jgi:hypothetical protein